jgi:hypothetical protein
MNQPPTRKRARWAAVPAQRSDRVALKVKLWLVLGTLLFSAAMGLLAIVVTLVNSGDSAPPPSSGPSPYSIAMAEAIAADFLAGRTTTQPVADGVSPSFFPPRVREGDNAAASPLPVTRLSYAASRTTVSGAQLVTLHSFLVSTREGRFLVQVPMAETAVGPVLGALPWLSPLPTYPAQPGLGLPDGADKVTISPLVTQRINEWAVAYATNDGNALAALVGNDDPTAVFLGLGGFTARAQPVWAYSRGPSAIVVRAQVLLFAQGANGFSTAMDVDLLVLNPETSRTPQIAAWGPAGSGPTLQPSANNFTR